MYNINNKHIKNFELFAFLILVHIKYFVCDSETSGVSMFYRIPTSPTTSSSI
jgi:hypothetical protein